MKETFYFKHDYNSHNDPKIERMIFKETWEGYGIYWALIEKLSQETGEWKLDCDYEALAFSLRTKYERIKNVIELYGLFEIKDGKFWSKRLLVNMLEREEKRQKSRDAINSRWAKVRDKNTDVSTVEHTDVIPVKESKGKEKKEYNTIFDFWNNRKITQHKKITNDIKLAIDKRLKEYSSDEIITAITNYDNVLKSEDTYFAHKWTLTEFMTRSGALPVFLHKSPSDYLKTSNKAIPKNSLIPTGEMPIIKQVNINN